MGTEILRPQDCLLAPRLRISPPSFHHRRKNYPTAGYNIYSYRKPAEVRTDQHKKPHPKRLSVDFRVVSKNTQNNNNNHNHNHDDNSNDNIYMHTNNVSILRRGQSLNSLNNKDSSYAGSGFSVSPPPSDLPLPNFSKKLSFDDDHANATKHLRRLLRLE